MENMQENAQAHTGLDVSETYDDENVGRGGRGSPDWMESMLLNNTGGTNCK